MSEGRGRTSEISPRAGLPQPACGRVRDILYPRDAAFFEHSQNFPVGFEYFVRKFTGGEGCKRQLGEARGKGVPPCGRVRQMGRQAAEVFGGEGGEDHMIDEVNPVFRQGGAMMVWPSSKFWAALKEAPSTRMLLPPGV